MYASLERNMELHQYFAVLAGMKGIKNLKQVNKNYCNEAFAGSFRTSLRSAVTAVCS